MNYKLIQDNMDLIAEFERANVDSLLYSQNIDGFKKWVIDSFLNDHQVTDLDWEGKLTGRSPESVISTFLVHMNRYAKNYSKSAIYGSDFTTQEDFIYLINLKAFGEMTKMELIKKNIQDKPVGMQTINRLIAHGWVEQKNSETDKRSKVVKITAKGLEVLENQMDKIRQATNIVTGDLTHTEKMELIKLLHKLNNFHHPIYRQNHDAAHLLTEAVKAKKLLDN